MAQPPGKLASACLRFARDKQGAAMVEFAIISPVLLVTILGLMDVGHTMYTNSLLQGAVQMAARESTIEGAFSNESNIDALVSGTVHRITPRANLTFDRKAYTTFDEVGQPEDYTDNNGDGICNANEPFEDSNGNGTWDPNRGTAGFGTPNDSVLYTVSVEYPRMFPVANLIGLPPTIRTEVSTVLRNQPYGEQVVSVAVGHCA